MARRVPPLLVNLLLSLSVTVLFAGALEGVFRWREGRRPPLAVADYIWDWDEKWNGEFYRIRSDSNGWPPWEQYNADGVRDAAHPEEKPDGVTRLVFLGDSVTLGYALEAEEAYPQVVQSRFDEGGVPVEVFNVALWGWSTRQERRAYSLMVRRYRPDVVVLGVCLNDIPELQNNLAAPPRWLTVLHQRSAVVRGVIDAPGREIQQVEQLFAEPESARVREAMARFFDEVRALRREVAADGSELRMAVFPFRFQVVRGAPRPLVQESILDFCAAEGLACLDLLPPIANMGEAAFLDYDHLSVPGAALVADALLNSDLLPRPTSHRERLGAAAGDPERMVEALSDPTAERRTAAAWGLGRLEEPGPAALAALTAALGDPAGAVRRQAALALSAHRPASRAAREALFAALHDPQEPVRWAAARSLFDLGVFVEERDRLGALLRHPDAYVRGFAAVSLGEMGAQAAAAVPALAEALALPDGYTRGGAVSALAKIGPAAAAAVPALIQGLQDPDGDRRWKAARALGRVGEGAAEAAPLLVAALQDPNGHVRLQAARALPRVAPASPEARQALLSAARDDDEAVREAARASLESLRR